MALVAALMLLTFLLLAALWWLGIVRPAPHAPWHAAEAAAEARRLTDARLEAQRLREAERATEAARAPRRASDEDLAVQQQRCAEVKATCIEAAKRMKAAHAEEGADAALGAALGDLMAVYEANERDGALGMIAMTELCNALLETDSLDILSSMQTHGDPNIASRSATLFQHIIPRIWSF